MFCSSERESTRDLNGDGAADEGWRLSIYAQDG